MGDPLEHCPSGFAYLRATSDELQPLVSHGLSRERGSGLVASIASIIPMGDVLSNLQPGTRWDRI